MNHNYGVTIVRYNYCIVCAQLDSNPSLVDVETSCQKYDLRLVHILQLLSKEAIN